MRILIDECLDWRLCRSLPDHECTSVAQRGWSGLTNGSLLGKAQNEFDVFITGDSNLQFQQNVSRFNIAVVILTAKSNRLIETAPLLTKLRPVLDSLEPGRVVKIS